MFRSLVIIASVVVAAHAFGSGAPPGVCDSLTPQHGADPKTEPSPYSITLSKSNIHPGDEVKVTLAGINNEKFKGFAIQGRLADGKTVVGTFDVSGTNGEAQTIDCPNGTKNAATHTNPKPKSSISLKWIAPNNLEEVVVFKVTFVKDGSTYWVGQKSSSLTVRH